MLQVQTAIDVVEALFAQGINRVSILNGGFKEL
jgi:hypothetical protein